MEGSIPTWSYSRLEVFEKCAYQAWKKYVEKAEEGHDEKRDAALKKGRDTHDAAEQFVRGELVKLPSGLKKFARQFEEAKRAFDTAPDSVEMEEDWGFTADWLVTGWWDDDVWLRVKLDYLEWLDDDKTAVWVKDYKTGRKDGNEVKHAHQMQLYVVATFMRYPEVKVVKATFEYLDHAKVTTRTYSREQAMGFMPNFDRRGRALTEAKKFSPNPSRVACRWCPFGPNKGNGSCEYGVEV